MRQRPALQQLHRARNRRHLRLPVRRLVLSPRRRGGPSSPSRAQSDRGLVPADLDKSRASRRASRTSSSTASPASRPRSSSSGSAASPASARASSPDSSASLSRPLVAPQKLVLMVLCRSSLEQAVAQIGDGPRERQDVGESVLSRVRCALVHPLDVARNELTRSLARSGLEHIITMLSSRLADLETRPATLSASASGSTPSSASTATSFRPPTFGYPHDSGRSPGLPHPPPPAPDLDLPPPDILHSLCVLSSSSRFAQSSS